MDGTIEQMVDVVFYHSHKNDRFTIGINSAFDHKRLANPCESSISDVIMIKNSNVSLMYLIYGIRLKI